MGCISVGGLCYNQQDNNGQETGDRARRHREGGLRRGAGSRQPVADHDRRPQGHPLPGRAVHAGVQARQLPLQGPRGQLQDADLPPQRRRPGSHLPRHDRDRRQVGPHQEAHQGAREGALHDAHAQPRHPAQREGRRRLQERLLGEEGPGSHRQVRQMTDDQ